MTTVPEFERAVREVMAQEGMSDEDARAALLRLADAVREPAPTYQPGDVAIATVRGAEGVRMWAAASLVDGGLIWHTAEIVGGWTVHRPDQVAVTSRAIVVSADDLARLLDELHTPQWSAGPYSAVEEFFKDRGLEVRP